jgi:hypothetical protein
MAGQIPLQQLARNRIQQEWLDLKVPFDVSTLPLHSTQSLIWTPDSLNANGSGKGFVVAQKGQVLEFFGYCIEQVIELSGNPNFKATGAETNLTKPRQTPGSADMVIEWLGIKVRGAKVKYPDPTKWAATPGNSVVNALTGIASIFDPSSLVIPQEFSSPAMLEDVAMQAVSPFLDISIRWDKKTTKDIGTLDQITGGGGGSYLRASGEPSPRGRFIIQEGYVWRHSPEPDSEMVVLMTLTEDVVIPVTMVTGYNDTSVDPFLAIYTELVLRVGGLQFSLPTKN